LKFKIQIKHLQSRLKLKDKKNLESTFSGSYGSIVHIIWTETSSIQFNLNGKILGC
jgi:hypothetical protein